MGLLLLAVLWLGGAALLLPALFFVVRSAVEGGIRRAPHDDVLRPSVRELVARRDSSV
jgi:hypothetical protein